MNDLRDRFQALDDLRAPDLWREVQGRAAALPQSPVRALRWVLILVTLLLALAVGGAALIGSGVIKLPVSVEASATPSGTPEQSAVVTPSWIQLGHLAEGRLGHTATLLANGDVLVVGGSTSYSGGMTLSTELFHPATINNPATLDWVLAAPTIAMHAGHTATLLQDGRVLVAGGWNGLSSEIYDPETGTWVATGSMSVARAGGDTSTLLASGELLVAGGYADTTSLDPIASAEIYSATTGTWRATGSMDDARGGQTATLLSDGRVLVVGGRGASGELATAELYDPGIGSWSPAAAAPVSFLGHTATLLTDGKVLVVGGWHSNSGITEASAFVYDPDSNTWAGAANLLEARGGHTATLLDNGQVLVSGGFGSDLGVTCGEVLASAELFDPSTGTWSAAMTMPQHRYRHVATPLVDGSVLITGGTDSGCMVDPLATTVLYLPGSGN